MTPATATVAREMPLARGHSHDRYQRASPWWRQQFASSVSRENSWLIKGGIRNVGELVRIDPAVVDLALAVMLDMDPVERRRARTIEIEEVGGAVARWRCSGDRSGRDR